jgi:hypothetical protein
VHRLPEQEGQVQEILWALENEIASLQILTYNAQEICAQLDEFVCFFPTRTDGERRLVVDALGEPGIRHDRQNVCAAP